MKGKIHCMRFGCIGGLYKKPGMEQKKKKKKSPEIWGYTMHLGRTTQLLFLGMRLNTSSRQQCDYNELVHWNVLRMEADPVQTSEKWGCYNVEYLINERKTEKIRQRQLFCIPRLWLAGLRNISIVKHNLKKGKDIEACKSLILFN